LNICPCCGSKSEDDLRGGCAACGAQPVGPPLARPERELPAYGHAFWLTAAGACAALAFACAVAAALLRRETLALGFDPLLRAALAAAWSLKWSVLPLSLLATAVGWRVYARMRREPSRFVGHSAARAGLALTAAVALTLAALVGFTVPERLRRRELARQAEGRALLYASEQALASYRSRFGTYPASLSDLRRLDDPDCEIANLLAVLEAGEYKPETDLASLAAGRPKGRARRKGARARTVAASTTDDLAGAGLSLTNYELTLPGRDKILGTADDLHLRDGRIVDGPRAASTPARAAAENRRAQ
jgi:hypothetical protein